MSQPILSVIVPVYNLEKYIEQSVQSIEKQTYRNLEIILVNDGSKDRSGKIMDDLAKKDSRIKVIHKQNEGVTKARLTGVAVASGEWIGFVDGDDSIDPDMYERLIANALPVGADISHCGYQMNFPGRTDYYYNTGRKLTQDHFSGIWDLMEGTFVEPGLVNKIYRKTLLDSLIESSVMDYSIKNNEDLLMNYYLFKEASLSVYEDWCPYHYMVRKESAATSALNENKLRDPLAVLKKIRDDAEDERIKYLADTRIAAQLIYLASLYDSSCKSLIRPYQKKARKELRGMLGKILRGSFSQKQKIQSLWVAVWPWSYHIVHFLYARWKGTDRKYAVE